MFMKIYFGAMILSFVGILVSIVGMSFGDEHFWKNVHPIFGGAFIVLVLGHLWFNKSILKALFIPRKKQPAPDKLDTGAENK